MISSFHCPSKEEKFCGCKYVDNSEWEAKYLLKRKYEWNIALFKIGSPLKLHTAKNNISLIKSVIFFSKIVCMRSSWKNNGGDIHAYFQILLKFHQSVCRKLVTTPIWQNKFKLVNSAIVIILNSPCNTLSWRYFLNFTIKQSEVSSYKISSSGTLCFDVFKFLAATVAKIIELIRIESWNKLI